MATYKSILAAVTSSNIVAATMAKTPNNNIFVVLFVNIASSAGHIFYMN